MKHVQKPYTSTLTTLIACSLFGSADAEEQPTFLAAKARLGLIEHAHIIVDDQVSDNCWTNSSTISAKTKLAFEQNNVSALDYDPSFYGWSTVQITLDALGGRMGGGSCVIYAKFEVSTWAWSILGGAENKQTFSAGHTATLFDPAALFTNGQNGNEQLNDFFEGAVAEFLADLLSARRTQEVVQIKELYPWIFAPPSEREE